MNSNQNITKVRQTKRIEYIDALRGFTMILVVFHHVAQFCWHVEGVSSIHQYLIQIRMPMFFFISGFVLYKTGIIWNTQQVISFFRKKIPVQILSPLIFFLFYIHSRSIPFTDGIFDTAKAGYWFTFVLFEYYVFYAITMFCIRNKYSSLVMLAVGLFLYYINYRPLFESIPLSSEIKGFLSISNWCFFIFFVLGTITKKNFRQFENFLSSKWTLPICISFYFFINGFKSIIPINSTIIGLPQTVTGLVILFSFFKINQSSFKKERVLGRTLQYVGRRTLDIYLIHYFLLPRNLSIITIFVDHPMPIIEATCSLIISIIIVAACLLFGNIIRLSPFLGHWMFGAKYPVTRL